MQVDLLELVAVVVDYNHLLFVRMIVLEVLDNYASLDLIVVIVVIAV